MRFIYFYTGAVNGEDSSGHYTRAGLVPNQCVDRAPEFDGGCSAKYFKDDTSAAATSATASAAKSGTTTRLLDYLLAP
jgi:hypothetical protein